MSIFWKVTAAFFGVIIVIVLLLKLTTHKSTEERISEYITEGNYPAAIELIEKEYSPNDPLYHILKARVYTAKGDYYQSLTELQSVVYNSLDDKKKAKLLAELVELAQKTAREHKDQIARKAYEYILQLEPDYELGEGFKFLAEFYFKSGDFGHSIPYFERYINSSSLIDSVIDHYIKALYEIGDYRRIVRYKDTIIEKGNRDSYTYLLLSLYKLARFAYESGNYTDAIGYLTQFFDLTQKIGRPRYIWEDAELLLADSYKQLGKYDMAKKHYENVAVFGETANKKKALERLNELPQ